MDMHMIPELTVVGLTCRTVLHVWATYRAGGLAPARVVTRDTAGERCRHAVMARRDAAGRPRADRAYREARPRRGWHA